MVHSLPIGSEIEVRSDEEGFKGAWFEAKVVSYVPRSRKYNVVFSNFVSEDNPSKPLEDTVYHMFVRPRPPRSDVDTRFAKYDLVEALLNDGWWKGVVSRAPRGKGVFYRVCFPSTREELECRKDYMREQLEWVKGEWARAQDMKGDNVFDVGNQVEVSRYKKRYGAAWYAGTVLKVIGKNNLLVEYESINGSKKMPLKEIVDLQYVRPFPPPLLKFDNVIDVLEVVEVCHNGGWVTGVVSNIRPGSRYVVKWKHKEIEFDQAALRPCYDWTNDRWVRINKDKRGKRKSLPVEGPTIAISASTFSVDDSEVAVKKSEDLKLEREIQTTLPSKKLKKEMPLEEHLKLTDIAKLIGHRRRSDRIKSLVHRRKKWFPTGRQSKLHAQVQNSKNNNGESATEFGIVNCGSETTSVIGKSCFDGPLLEGRPTLLVEQQQPPAQLKAGTKSEEVCHEQDMSRVNGDDSINSAEGSCFLGDASQQLSKNFGHLRARDEAADFLPIADLGNYKACRGLTKSTEMQKLSFDHKRHTFDVADMKQHAEEMKKHKSDRSRMKKMASINVNVQQYPEEEGKTNKVGRPPKKIIGINCNENEHVPEERKKHRGRPKKFRNINGTKAILEEGERVVGNEYGREFVDPTYQTLAVDASEKVRESKNSLLAVNADGSTDANDVTNTCLSNMQADITEDFTTTNDVESFVQEPKSPYYSDIQQSPVLICGSSSLTEAEARINVSKNTVETENATIDPAPVASEHNQKVYGEADDVASIDPSPDGSSPSREENFPNHSELTPNRPLSEKTVTKSEKAPSDQDDLTLPSPKGASLSNKTALPFTKESSMWEAIESMEAFQTMPQQPHFHPLEQYEVEFREGMAIGLMVTFANLATSIQKLRITDSPDIFEEKLKALTPLELNGFKVQPVRSRLEKLMEIQNGASQSESKKAYLKEQIMEREEEKEELDMLISEHDKLILELEENLHHCRKKKTSMVWGSNKKDSEIVQLKIDLQATEEAFFWAEEHFNTSADAPW